MNEKDFFLGIDTSNYKTSVAVVDGLGRTILDERKLIDVAKGERGIRQSEAVFQHTNNFPLLIKSINNFPEIKGNIKAVSVSSKPRPVQGSYMPVFNCGYSLGSSLSSVLGIPFYEFSHQEGHIEAVKFGSKLENSRRFIAFHFSGGTTEAVLAVRTSGSDKNYQIVGGSRDISYGQLLDRVGVAMGISFPCGREMDKTASCFDVNSDFIKIPRINVKDGYINISGQETFCLRAVENSDSDSLIHSLFKEITYSIKEMTIQLAKKYEVNDFIYAGGVASSRFIRENLKLDYNICFGSPELSADNAVGIALLGRSRYGIETDNGNSAK